MTDGIPEMPCAYCGEPCALDLLDSRGFCPRCSGSFGDDSGLVGGDTE